MGKLEKTDRTGKTVEAWWALLVADGSLGQSVIRWVWPVIGVGVGTWVASATDWIGSYGVAGWAATAMLGALGFVWTAVGIDHFRSRRARDYEASIASDLDYQPATLDRVPQISEEQVNALIELRFAALLAETLPARFETHSQAHARDERLAQLSDRIDATRLLAESSHASITHSIQNHGMDIRSLEEQVAQLRRDFDAWAHDHNRDQDQRFKFVDGGFRAIGDRERLTKIAERIEAGSQWLLQTSEGKKLDWIHFEVKRSKWREEIASYGVIASHYLVDVPDLISAVPAEKLTGHWPEDRNLFPNDDAMLAHRTVAVMLRNFREQHDRVMDCVNSFAFNSPSMKGVPEG